jgi:hypothetical protein
MDEMVHRLFFRVLEAGHCQKRISREKGVAVFFFGHVDLLDWGRRSLRPEQSMHRMLAVPRHTGLVSRIDR